ncbi:MAG: ArsR family transcriptional regulator [Desulfobulbaceae bacterium BRH_c16a]|nr:MAG: ArsR family transcriptional regulator [Desulfobulbaceae bacterium BRH_c16a]
MKNMISVFKALSERNRLRIVAALAAHDELCACQLTEMLEVSGATASRHLGVLLGCGLLDSRKDGRWVYYRLLADGSESLGFAPVLAWLRAEFDKSEDIVIDRQRLRAITLCGPEEFCRKHRGGRKEKIEK